MLCQSSFQRLFCARRAAARAAHENLLTAELRADRVKTIGLSRLPSPWEKHRGDNLGAKVRDRSYECKFLILECGLTIARCAFHVPLSPHSAIRNPQLQCPMAFIKYVNESHVDRACDRVPGCEWLCRPARTTNHPRSSGAV